MFYFMNKMLLYFVATKLVIIVRLLKLLNINSLKFLNGILHGYAVQRTVLFNERTAVDAGDFVARKCL